MRGTAAGAWTRDGSGGGWMGLDAVGSRGTAASRRMRGGGMRGGWRGLDAASSRGTVEGGRTRGGGGGWTRGGGGGWMHGGWTGNMLIYKTYDNPVGKHTHKILRIMG